jgi:hypothetical protein
MLTAKTFIAAAAAIAVAGAIAAPATAADKPAHPPDSVRAAKPPVHAVTAVHRGPIASKAPATRINFPALEAMAARGVVQRETVTFGQKAGDQESVQVFRGVAHRGPPEGSQSTQILSFGAAEVSVVRGVPAAPPSTAPALQTAALAIPAALRAEPASPSRTERISFGPTTVIVMRGLSSGFPPIGSKVIDDSHLADLFGPANGDELDRIAFAVEGVESRHGADLRMWRSEPGGPQGPMQVSAAAALDVGGGDRFDIGQNRVLGRAYLERMFKRYGNWPDTLKAYNWGPGNLDQWILGGRDANRLPVGVATYVSRVLHDALMRTAAFGM